MRKRALGMNTPSATLPPLCKRGMNSPRLKPYPSARGEWNKFSSVEEYSIHRGEVLLWYKHI
jgi:hypothetical protein